MAQVAGSSPATSGTLPLSLQPADLHGVDVVEHHASVLAVELVVHRLFLLQTGTLGVIDTRPLRVSSKLCLNSPRLSRLVTLLT